VLLTDEGFWQDQRRFVLRHLREFGFGRRTMAELVEEEAEQLVKAFQQKLDGSQVGKVVTIFARRYIFCV
jgi:Cytochrome P450.